VTSKSVNVLLVCCHKAASLYDVMSFISNEMSRHDDAPCRQVIQIKRKCCFINKSSQNPEYFLFLPLPPNTIGKTKTKSFLKLYLYVYHRIVRTNADQNLIADQRNFRAKHLQNGEEN